MIFRNILLCLGVAAVAACGASREPEVSTRALTLYPGETPELRVLINKYADAYEVPRPLRVEDARGRPVAVDARGTLSASPAVLVSQTGARRDLTAWAGPWPLDERWWDQAAARRTQRFQAVDTAGEAWLLELDEAGEWWAAGRYD